MNLLLPFRGMGSGDPNNFSDDDPEDCKTIFHDETNKNDKKYRRHAYWIGDKQKTINQINGIKILEVKMAKLGDEYIPFGRFRGWRIIDVYRRPRGKQYMQEFVKGCNVDVGLYGYIMSPILTTSHWRLKK